MHLIRMNSVHDCPDNSVAVPILNVFVTYSTCVACCYAGSLLYDDGLTMGRCGVA